MEKQKNETKNKEKEPKIYCCFSDTGNEVKQVLGMAFKDFVELNLKINKAI